MIFRNFAQINKPQNLPDVTPTAGTLQNVIAVFLQFATAITFIYVIISAIRFSASYGDTGKIAQARKSLIYAIVGLVVSVSALSIAMTAQSLGGSLANSANPFFSQNGLFGQLAQWLIGATGVISAIMLILAGLRYISSGGNSSTLQAARNTIIYAIVGLVLAGFGQFIIGFVLNRI